MTTTTGTLSREQLIDAIELLRRTAIWTRHEALPGWLSTAKQLEAIQRQREAELAALDA